MEELSGDRLLLRDALRTNDTKAAIEHIRNGAFLQRLDETDRRSLKNRAIRERNSGDGCLGSGSLRQSQTLPAVLPLKLLCETLRREFRKPFRQSVF
jgi:hypothetical protein